MKLTAGLRDAPMNELSASSQDRNRTRLYKSFSRHAGPPTFDVWFSAGLYDAQDKGTSSSDLTPQPHCNGRGPLGLGRNIGHGERVRREHEAAQDVDLVADKKLLGQSLGNVGRKAAPYLGERGPNFLPGDFVAVLLHVQFNPVVKLSHVRHLPEKGMINPILTVSGFGPRLRQKNHTQKQHKPTTIRYTEVISCPPTGASSKASAETLFCQPRPQGFNLCLRVGA